MQDKGFISANQCLQMVDIKQNSPTIPHLRPLVLCLFFLQHQISKKI